MLTASLKNNGFISLVLKNELFYAEVNNKHLFDPVDSLYTLLTCQSLNHQQL